MGVGATDLSLKVTGTTTHIVGEVAWSCLAAQYPACAATSALGAGTGGGVSRIYTKKSDNLSWQTGPGVKNKQSTGNRQVPDVAASGSAGLGNGHGYVIFYHNAWTVGGGTSAAMPIWAGLILLADQYVTQRGRARSWPKVNPLVYPPGEHGTASSRVSRYRERRESLVWGGAWVGLCKRLGLAGCLELRA